MMISLSFAGLLGAIGIPFFLPVTQYCILLILLILSGFLLLFSNAKMCMICLLSVVGGVWTLHAWKTYQESVWRYHAVWKKAISLVGIIQGVPERREQGVRFELAVEPASDRMQLYWAGKDLPKLEAGQRWQLEAILKPPMGLVNPNTWSPESYYWERHLVAVGVVKKATYLSTPLFPTWKDRIAQVRQATAEKVLAYRLSEGPLILALSLGMTQYLSPKVQWAFRQTGTTHLMAISGMNLAVVNTAFFFLGRQFGRLWSTSALRCPIPLLAAGLAILGSGVYTCLAGSALATVRAWVMLLLGFSDTLSQGRLLPSQKGWWALVAMIAVWPESLVDIGFWLSFLAVASIYFSLVGSGKSWKEGIWLQLKIGLLLAPFTAFFFGQWMPITFLANAIAIPWISFVFPICLMALLLVWIWPSLGALLLEALNFALQGLTTVLERLAGMMETWWFTHWSLLILVLVTLSLVICLVPTGFPGRFLGLYGLLLGLPTSLPTLTPGHFSLTMLDVGQGLSVLVRTAHHALLYDTGPGTEQYDLAEPVLFPVFRWFEIPQLSGMVISHGDADHSGGARSVYSFWPVKWVLSGEPKRLHGIPAKQCEAGQQWEWDGVTFHVLFPEKRQSFLQKSFSKRHNENSCVMKVSSGKHSILLTGDIEDPEEKKLVTGNVPIVADILIAPHHGSKGASDWGFAEAVHPRIVLFSTGRLNQFHFPSDLAVKHYCRPGVWCGNTAFLGSITVTEEAEGWQIITERNQRPMWYRVIDND